MRPTRPRDHRARARYRPKRAADDPRPTSADGTFYMVSRPGGYNVLGASSEERARPGPRSAKLQRLLRDALEWCPTSRPLRSSRLVRAIDRPVRTSDHSSRCWSGGRWAWSSGHFRHGVTLAPLAADEAASFRGGCRVIRVNGEDRGLRRGDGRTSCWRVSTSNRAASRSRSTGHRATSRVVDDADRRRRVSIEIVTAVAGG